MPSQSSPIDERLSLVSVLQSALDLRSRDVSNCAKLAFKPVEEFSALPGELDDTHGETAVYVAHRHWVEKTLADNSNRLTVGDKHADASYAGTLEAYKRERQRLIDIERREWEKKMWAQFVAPGQDVLVPKARPSSKRESLEPFILAMLLMVAVLHTLSGVAFPAAEYILATMKAVVFGAFTLGRVFNLGSYEDPLTRKQRDVLKEIPLDLETVIGTLGLDPDITVYPCCPKCFATHPPISSYPDGGVPLTCTRGEGTDAHCDAALVRAVQIKPKHKNGSVKTVYRPLKSYVYRKFGSWLEEFLGRPGVEGAVKESWARQPDPTTCSDIMDSSTIRQFLGPDGRTLFSVQTEGSIHLLFSLFIDWFNPYGNKKAGKAHSIGAIYLACLNLPPHLRYRPENIYLAGIIPGPKEPSLDQLNELLRPLVEDLLELWIPGLVLRTATRSGGRLVRAAVVPLVCDLPALRKAAGFASHSSKNFCSFCPLTLDNINNVERSTWPSPRTWLEHLVAAERWKNAPSETARNTLVALHGIRWSELLRLPYWDPTRYAMLDAMHNLFLGEILHHCKQVWGVDVAQDKQPSAPKLVQHTPEEQQRHLNRLYAATCSLSTKTLANIRKDYLSAVARFNNIVGHTSSELTRQDIASALVDWAQENDPKTLRLPPVLNEPATRFRLPADEPPPQVSRYDIFTSDVLERVREDIRSVTLPSWMERPPANFGSAAHGKLKADIWRTVATVHMVITLVRLWGSAHASEEERDVLANFVHLVSAVTLATRRSMTRERAASYDEHMQEYLRGLRRLYDHKLVPNHHLSLHLRPLLEAFGPVHGWWAFPFERYNGILQRMNTNSRAAEMPATFMRGWYIGAQLRWLMRTTQWPEGPEYSEMIRKFEGTYRERVRGSRITDILHLFEPEAGPDFPYDRKWETKLTPSVYDDLLDLINSGCSCAFQSVESTAPTGKPRLAPMGHPAPAVEHNGVKFATAIASARDSYITFRTTSGSTRAGQIAEIFYHQRAEEGKLVVQPFLVVNIYKELNAEHCTLDPYRQFPDLDAKLVYNEYDSRQSVVPLDMLQSHFAFCKYEPAGIGKECVVVRSLDRS